MWRSIIDFYDVWKKNCTVFPNIGEYGNFSPTTGKEWR
jgi:hypothetical protein